MSNQTKTAQVQAQSALTQLDPQELQALAGGVLPVRRDVINWQTNGVH